MKIHPMMIAAPVSIAIGYTMGNFNPSYLIGKMQGFDVREVGTQNAGASNILMLSGKKLGAAVAILDILKAASAGWICKALFPKVRQAGLIGSTAAQLGHMFPVALGFRGGKGLACMGGVVLSHDPKMLLKMLAFAIAIGFGSGYIALATISMAIIWPICYGLSTQDLLGTGILLIPAGPIFYRHIPNLQRIAKGEEARLDYLWKGVQEIERIGALDLAPVEVLRKKGLLK